MREILTWVGITALLILLVLRIQGLIDENQRLQIQDTYHRSMCVMLAKSGDEHWCDYPSDKEGNKRNERLQKRPVEQKINLE